MVRTICLNTSQLYTSTLGASINVKLVCNDGHTNKWSSSEGLQHKKRKVSKLNVAIVVHHFLNGLQFQVFKVG